MRSRAARLTLSITAWAGLGAAAFFLVNTEQQLAQRRAALRAFDADARKATDALADARGGQQAYVAAGQDAGHWIPQVAELTQQASASIDSLRATAASDSAGKSLLDSSQALAEFANVDKQVRDYLRTGENLMASDVVFNEADDVASRAASGVEAAVASEQGAFDDFESLRRTWEAYALGGAAGWSVLVMVILSFAGAVPRQESGTDEEELITAPVELPLGRLEVTPQRTHVDAPVPAAAAPASLTAAAEICTDISQARDRSDLEALLGRASRVLDASGLVVWVAGSAGADLHPVLAYGYSDKILAMMKSVPSTADNAAANAYRSGMFQVVPGRQGSSLGAVAAPLLSADGSVGSLTAEIRGGGESSPAVQAVVSILAAQLAGIVSGSISAPAEAPQSRTASA